MRLGRMISRSHRPERAAIMKAEGEKWGKLIRATGIKAD